MSEQLKPCPFCGGDAELDSQQGFRRMSDGVIRTGIAVYCVKCSAQIHFCRDDIPDLTPEFVINLWNTRAAQPETREDPYESEDYQRFVASMVPHCHCRESNRPCDGVLAGGLCDNIQDEPENEKEE